MGIIGTLTCLPSPKFSLVRSYLYDIDIALYGDGFSGTGSVRFIHAVPPDPTFITIIFDNDWYVWNSNGRTLDNILTDFYVQTPPSTVKTPLPVTLGYWYNPATKRPGLFLNWYTGARTPVIIPLPSQPFGYWAPRPLP